VDEGAWTGGLRCGSSQISLIGGNDILCEVHIHAKYESRSNLGLV
jgi:hypothetical protein